MPTRRAIPFRVFAALLGIVLTRGPLVCQAQTQQEAAVDAPPVVEPLVPPGDPALAERIGELIANLNSPDYQERESSTLKLIEIGAPAFEPLHRAYETADDLETRLRVERVVHTAFLNDRVFSHNGFLGVSQNPTPILGTEDRRIPEGHFGVRIERVIPNTAAAEAGLQKGDIVMALDDELLPAAGITTTTAVFSEALRIRGPGTPLSLMVLRGQNRMKVDVVLGARPRRYYGPNQGKVYEMLDTARKEFAAFWAAHFGGEVTVSEDELPESEMEAQP